jgi:hypothetical protein
VWSKSIWVVLRERICVGCWGRGEKKPSNAAEARIAFVLFKRLVRVVFCIEWCLLFRFPGCRKYWREKENTPLKQGDWEEAQKKSRGHKNREMPWMMKPEGEEGEKKKSHTRSRRCSLRLAPHGQVPPDDLFFLSLSPFRTKRLHH